MITKYARVEEILEVKSSSRMNYNDGGNDKLRFAKFAAMSDGVRKEDDYLYVKCRAISSRVNKNNDGWPSEELSKAYKTFENRPIFVDHNNNDPKRTRGVIVASDLHVDEDKKAALDPYYANAPDNHKPPTWIELLLEVDAKTYPKLAEKIEKGDLDAVSMGANIENSICSVCAHEASTPSEYCKHIKQKGTTFEVTSDNGQKIRKKAYEDCYGVNFFEISFVFDPADPTADAGHSFKGASLQKKAAEAGVNFDEVRSYLEARGDKVEMLSDMIGKNLPMERVASIKHALDVEQFMRPSDTQDAGKNRNYIPQSEMITAPEHVDTLRNDQRCPVCHAAEMESGADGVMSCPVCGHVQEPEPLNNPDLEVARDNQLRQDNAQPDQNVLPVEQGDPLDAVQFDTQQIAQPTSKKSITQEEISEMFQIQLRTTSKEEADRVLPAKVARVETKLGHGVHRGVYDAAREAGLKVKVSYPGVTSTEENSVEVPGDNGIFNLFFAEESAINGKVPMNEVPVVIEAASAEEAEAFAKILAETPLPSRKRAENDKQPLLPGSKPSDEPSKETVVEDPSEPVESKIKEALELDGTVTLDGKKYKLQEITEESSEESDDDVVAEADADKPAEDAKPAEESAEKKEDSEEKEEDREARLLAAFALADAYVELGLKQPEEKMAFIAELEEETLEQLDARKATLETVKAAGLSRRTAHVPGGIKRVPRLSHAVPTNGSGPQYNDDTPIEALFL